jgi:hypothetical protein
MNGMNYFYCRYCPQFKLEHPKPIPVSFIKLALKEKMLFDYHQNKRQDKKQVLIEKYEPHRKYRWLLTSLRKIGNT